MNDGDVLIFTIHNLNVRFNIWIRDVQNDQTGPIRRNHSIIEMIMKSLGNLGIESLD